MTPPDPVPMKRILIAGADQTGNLIPGDTPTPPALMDPAALLLQARHEAEYLSRLLAKLRTDSGLSTATLKPVARPGPLGRLQGILRQFLWKLLRYQHDHMAFQQNAINTQSAAAMEFLREEYRHELDLLNRRLTALESRLSTPPHDPAPRQD